MGRGRGGRGRERRGLTGSLWPTQCHLETQVGGAEPGPKSPISPAENSAFSREGEGWKGEGEGRGLEGRASLRVHFGPPSVIWKPRSKVPNTSTFLCRRLWKFDSYSY